MKHWRQVLVVLVLAAAAAFFARELRSNFEALKELRPQLGAPLVAAVSMTILAAVLGIGVWRVTINMMAAPAHLPRLGGFVIMSISSFAKYVPGKLWSIGLQTTWLAKLGFPPSLVVAANLLNVLVSFAVSLSIGAIYLLWLLPGVPVAAKVAATVALVAAHVVLIFRGGAAFGRAAGLLGKIFKRDFALAPVAPAVLGVMAIGYLCVDLSFGTAAYFAGQSLGLGYGPELLPTFLCGVPVANALGFAVLFMPGGIGVREGVLYLALHEVGGEIVALTVPIWTRILTMSVELSMFAAATTFYRVLRRKDRAS